MTKSFELFYSISCLDQRVISCSNCSHWSWLIPCIWLCWILKVTIWSSWTVHTDIASYSYMRASVRLAHHSDNCYTWCSSDWFPFKNWSQLLFMRIRQCSNKVNKFWHFVDLVFSWDSKLDFVDVDLFTFVIGLYELANNFLDSFDGILLSILSFFWL